MQVGQEQTSPISIDVQVETRVDKDSYSLLEEGRSPMTAPPHPYAAGAKAM
jgi:hypothetical protein